MTRTCLSLTGTTLQENIDLLKKNRQWIDLAELRVDFLKPDELEHVDTFPSRTGGLPVILTIRKTGDGGFFTGGDRERKKLFLRCLSGGTHYHYADIEEDFSDADTEALLKLRDIRIIRSFHDFEGVPDNLAARISGLRRTGKEILKAAVFPRSTADVLKIFQTMACFKEDDTIILGMDDAGFSTRVLSPLFGSFLTFTSGRGQEAAPGHIDPVKLHNVYRFSAISDSTKVFGIIGNPVMHSYSPVIHNAGYGQAGINAVYIPFQIDSVESFFSLCPLLGIEGFSVTHPFKEKIIGFLEGKGEEVEKIGACNTVRLTGSRWEGRNFDWSGFLEPLKGITDDFSGMKATVVGAGGAARAVVYALKQARMEVLVLNRTPKRAKDLAGEFDCEWGALDGEGIKRIDGFSDLIVQASSLGMGPHEDADPLENLCLEGHEIVYDLVYVPEKTKLLQRAEEAGCRVFNGKQMLLRQAYSQFEYFTGRTYPLELKQAL